MLFKIVSLKNFAIFTRKQPVLASLFNKVAPVTFLKRDPKTDVSCGYC